MKKGTWLRPLILLVTILTSVAMPLLQPATPAYAWTPQTWNTQAQFNAGVRTNVDTSYSPNNVLLASSLDTGDGSDRALTVTGTYIINTTATGLSSTSYIGSNFIGVTSTTGFAAGQEVLIIQMTGTGAGTWETAYIAPSGVEPTVLVFTTLLTHAYYADANSKAQVIKVPHYTTVTINLGGILMCRPWLWDGQTGGVIFFRATGTVSDAGSIDATGTGFNGGNGGSGAYGGSGAAGGQGGGNNCNTFPNGCPAWGSGTGGLGGDGGVNVGGAGYDGGNGSQYGSAGNRSSGGSGTGPGGGSSDRGGTNGSNASLSIMQIGSGGGGGSSGVGGYGGGGGGGGGYNTCIESKKFGGGPYDGTGGSSGGNPGSGGNGSQGGGLIGIYAKYIVVQDLIKANGVSGTAGSAGSNGGSGGSGGGGQNWCFVSYDNPGSAGGGGGGGGGAQGGGGGNGGCGGSGGTIWLAAENITISQTNGVVALGGLGLAGGTGGNGGGGGGGGYGGSGDHSAAGQNGGNGPNGGNGATGTTGSNGGAGAIRLDYASLSGSTTPAPGYVSGVYYNSGTIASNVWDTGAADQTWTYLSWQETLPANTDITFEARASDTSFLKDASSPAWISVGGTSPVVTGLPSGQYMQWRATLTTSNNFNTPVLHSVTAASSQLPIVATDAATFVGNNGANANGTLLSLGQRSSTVQVGIQWGSTPTPDLNWQRVGFLSYTAPGSYSFGLNSLSPGTTYYYRAMAIDIDPASPVYGDIVSFTTMPVSPSVTTNPAGSVTSSSAILNGNLASLGGASTVNVSFQWGTRQGGPYPNSTTPQARTSAGAFQAGLSSLGPNTTYYYRAVADGGANGTNYGGEVSFTTSRMPPNVSTNNASSVTSNSATLNGNLSNLGTATTVNVSLQWGTTQGGPYPNSTPVQAMSAAGPFSAGLTGLAAKTTYYFRAKADGGFNGISYGSENSFTTSIVQPTVVTVGATNITSSSATLNGYLTAMGTAATVNVSFYYGLNPDEPNHTASQTLSAPGSFQVDLTGLAPGTLYYFSASAQGDGNSVDGAELTFSTSRVPPSVSTDNATNIGPNSATLYGTLTDLGSASSDNVSFQYGTTSGMYSVETSPQPMSVTGDFQADLSSLSSNTTYYYRAKANGGINGIGYGDELVFTTSRVPPTVATDNATNLTTNSAALNGNLTGLGTATSVNVSFQYGTTQGGPYPNTTASQAKAATGAFQINASGLSPRTTYYYRAEADGGVNGIAHGAESSFSTGSFPPYAETMPATGTDDHTSTLNGRLYFLGSATTVNVYFLYGTAKGGPYPNSTTKQAMTATGDFQAAISSLTPGTTYYFRARADGGTYGASAGAEMAFTTSKIPPSVTTNAAGGITSENATLNGNLDSLGDAATVNAAFQWGTNHGGPYQHTTANQAMTTTGAFSAGLSNLDGNTTYYFRAKADGGIYGSAYGTEQNFTTSKVPPTVYTDNATDVAVTTATLHGFLDSMGTASSVNTWFVYGTTSGHYTNSTAIQAMQSRGFLQAKITGLSPLTTYYFRAEADGGAHGTSEGAECSFTTGATPPSVFTGGATPVDDVSETLNGSLHSLGTATTVKVSFQYGTASGVYTEETALQAKTATGDFTANLVSLQPNTTYYYRAKGDGGVDGSGYGVEHSFITKSRPPSVATDNTTDWTTDTAFLNGNLTSLGTATTVNVSFIYGTTAGGPYPNLTTQQATTATGTFNAPITGLSPHTTYYFKAVADGGIYGTSYGDEMNFTTNHLPPVVDTGSAVDIMTNAAILNGNLYLPGSATTINVSFEYCTTHGGPYTNSTSPQAMTNIGPFVAQLSSLNPATTYYYRAKGDGGADGIGYGAEQAFTTGTHPPLAATSGASDISISTAVLNGNLVSLGTATTANVSFIYGTRQGGPYPNVTPSQAKTSTGAFQAGLSALSARTAYYFRARADGGIYGGSYGAEMSFTTSYILPSVNTVNASNLTGSTAKLNGRLTSLGSAGAAAVSFQYGTESGNYTHETTAQIIDATGDFSADVTGLTLGAIYYFRAKAVGDGTNFGEEKRFISRSNYSIMTDLGIVTFDINTGSMANLAWIRGDQMPCGVAGYIFPYGMFSYSLTGLLPGQTVTVNINFPNPVPMGAKFFKCQNGNVIDCSAFMARPNVYTFTLTLTDGGQGDADGVANGTIVDPGGPAYLFSMFTNPRGSSVPVPPQQTVQLSSVLVKSASLSDEEVTPGTPVTVTAIVANTGGVKGSALVRLYINGEEESSQGINVNSYSTRSTTFIVSRDEPGTYTVYVGNTPAGSFTVNNYIDPNIILLISLLLIFASLVLGFVYIWRRRRQET